MADANKEKPLVDPYSLMKTEDLLKQLEKHYENTPEGADRREGYDHERQGYFDLFESVQNSYLTNKRGKSSKTPGSPKRFALSKEKVNEESSELVNKILLSMVENDHLDAKGKPIKSIVDYYKANPHRLRDYAAGKGIDYEKIKQDLIQNYRNIKKADKYNEFKSQAAHMLVKDEEKIERAHNELSSNVMHHPKIKSHVKNALQKTGYTLEESVSAPRALSHYVNHMSQGGKLNENYVFQNGLDIKKYKQAA
jgi:hypothetical protein